MATRGINKNLVQHLPDVVTLLDPKHHILFHNASFYRVLQYQEGETIGAHISKIIHPEDWPILAHALNTSHTSQAEEMCLSVRYKTKKGGYAWMEACMANHVENGSVEGRLISSRKTSVSKLATPDLLSSKQVMDRSPLAFILIGQERQIIQMNQSGVSLLSQLRGKPAKEGDSADDYFDADKHPEFWAYLSRAYQGDSMHTEQLFPMPGQEVLWLETYYHPITDNSGAVSAIGFSAIDITERKNQELHQHQLSLVARHIDAAVVITDRFGITEWVNEAFTVITGYTPDEIVGRKPGELLQGPSTDPATVAFMSKKIKAGEGFQIEAINYQKNKTLFWMSVLVSPVYNEQNELTHFVGVESDITARKNLQEQVYQHLALVNAIQESSHSSIFALDRQYRYISFNAAHQVNMQEMFGIDIALGVNILQIIPPGKSRDQLKMHLDIALQGKQFSIQEELDNSFELKRFYEISYNPIRTDADTITGVAVYAQDITQRIHATQERDRIFHELHLYKRVLDKSAMISIIDTEGRITHVNNLACKTTKYAREELVGRNYRILDSGYHSLSFFEEIWATIHQGKIWRGEICYRAKDGSLFWVDTVVNPLVDKNGHVAQYLSLHYDITERKQAEERIKRSEATLREAQAVAKIGNWEYNLITREVFWSDELFNIYEVDPAKGVPTFEEIQTFYHPDDWPAYSQAASERILQGLSYSMDIRLLLPDGRTKYINVIGCPIIDAFGNVQKVYGTIMDIDERKRIEQHLHEQNEELQKINAQLDRFVYSVSHDLRAPLASVLGLITIAQMDPDPHKKDEYMEFMRKSVNKLDNFIRSIIDFSRNSRTAVVKERIYFDKLIEEVRQGIHYMEEAEKIRWEIEIRENKACLSDPKRLSIILNNLLSNAVRYSDFRKADPYIHVNIHVTSRTISIIVSDNGFGIDPEHQDKIFNMFYRASEKSSGSGLGLYIVKETVDILQGTINVRSTPKEGTTFTVTIPNQVR